jgi:hypothetical protein
VNRAGFLLLALCDWEHLALVPTPAVSRRPKMGPPGRRMCDAAQTSFAAARITAYAGTAS